MNDLFEKLVIVEGIASARTTYLETDKISKEIFDRFVKKDPSKNKKYIDWMCKQYVLNPDKEGHIPDVTIEFNRLADKNLIKDKDINRYDLGQAEEAIGRFGQEEREKDVAKGKEKDVEIILDTDKVLIVSPRTKEASCKYGKGTKWCTAASKSTNYFDSYDERGVKLYYIIDKKTGGKYAIAMLFSGEREVYDAKDKRIPYSKVKGVLRKLGVDV